MKQISFSDLYKYESEKPTPRQAFVAEVARITAKAEATVKQWANGIQVPDKLSIQTIANHFGCDPETLFPNKTKKATQQ